MPFRGFWTQAAVWEGAGSSSPCPQAAGEEEFEDGSQKSVFVFVFEATFFFFLPSQVDAESVRLFLLQESTGFNNNR